MTFTNILADVYRRTRYQASPAADVVTRIKGFCNECQQELAMDPRLQSLLRGFSSLTSVASQATYGLPSVVNRVTKIRDTTNRWALTQGSLDWYRRVLSDPSTDQGTPAAYVLLGPKPVSAHPASTGVWAVSSSASDTVPTVSLEAVRSGGYPHSPSATTLTGTTRVQLGAQTDYVEITDVYLSAACVGDVTLFDASSSGNTLGVIPKGQTRATYQWIALVPTPSAALTYQIDYEGNLTDLVNPTDEPYWLPQAFHRLLAVGARRKEYEFLGSNMLGTATQEWVVGVQQLVASVNNAPDSIVVPNGSRIRRSDLGSQYPAGTIWD